MAQRKNFRLWGYIANITSLETPGGVGPGVLEERKGKLGTGNATHGEPAGLVAVVLRVHIWRIEVQEVAEVTIIHGGGPIVPVRPNVVQRSANVEAGVGKACGAVSV